MAASPGIEEVDILTQRCSGMSLSNHIEGAVLNLDNGDPTDISHMNIF